MHLGDLLVQLGVEISDTQGTDAFRNEMLGWACRGGPPSPTLSPRISIPEPVGTPWPDPSLPDLGHALGSRTPSPTQHVLRTSSLESLTDVFGSDGHRPSQLSDELFGVQADLDDVIQQREQRGQGEGRHE